MSLRGSGRRYIERDQPDCAADCFLAAIALDPENARAHLGLGQILLGRGDFGPGWIEYEWRNSLPEESGALPRAPPGSGPLDRQYFGRNARTKGRG